MFCKDANNGSCKAIVCNDENRDSSLLNKAIVCDYAYNDSSLFNKATACNDANNDANIDANL